MLKVNLQPKITMEAREGFRMPLWPAILLLVLLISGSVGSYWLIVQDLLDKEAKIKQLEFKLRDFQQIISDYETAVNEKEYLKGKRDFVLSISDNQKQWIDFFDQVKEKTPKDVWFTRFNGNRTGNYDVEGNTFTFASVGFLMLQINSITHVNSVILSNTSEGSGGGGGDNPMAAITKKFKITGAMSLAVEKKEEDKPGRPGTPGKPGATAKPGTTTKPGTPRKKEVDID